MKGETWRRVGIAVVVCLTVASCRGASEVEGEADQQEVSPATVEHLDGPQPTRVTLTEAAARRLDIQTARVEAVETAGETRKVIPYAAILYDTEGNTWTYANPQPLVYVRYRVVVDHIAGTQAFLTDGPEIGMAVVQQGAQELYGSEVEFEEE